MKLSILSLIFVVVPLTSVSAKPVEILRGRLPESVLSEDADERARASQACHLQDHLAEHVDYIHREVFPRIERELDQLLRPQTDAQGQRYFIAESVDYGDLFHSHIRNPLSVIATGASQLDPQFRNSELYHLQYHSYEYLEYLQINWLRQLQRIENSELQTWLSARQDYIEAAEANQGDWSGGRAANLPELDPLTEEQRTRFARLWHSSLGSESPGLRQLNEKLKYLDPKDYRLSSHLLDYRSVVSTNEKFLIIDPLNFDDYWQPATVYFEELEDSPEVRAVVERASMAGLNQIINTHSRYFRRQLFPADTNWELHTSLMNELIQAARITTARDPLYMFGHALESSVDVSSHVTFGWSERYLFSVRYFLPCDEEERNLADTLTESERFPVHRP